MLWIIAGNGTAPDIWASPTKSHCLLQNELLLEKADLFYPFWSSPVGTVTQDDILDITDNLAEDGRYKALDRMDADQKLLLFQVHNKKHFHFANCYIDLINLVSAHSDELWHRSMVIQKAYIFLPTKPAHIFSIQFSFVNLCATYFAITNLFLAPGICSLSY